MKVTHAGLPCVALMGSDISDHQAELLCTHFERLVLFLDGDEAGRRGTDRALVEIGRRGRYVRAVLLPDGCQPDELPVDEIRRLLARGSVFRHQEPDMKVSGFSCPVSQ